jgi:hypothetical protein
LHGPFNTPQRHPEALARLRASLEGWPLARAVPRICGEAAQPAVGEADQPAVGEADQPAVGEADQPAVGEADQPAVGEADQPAVGEADQLRGQGTPCGPGGTLSMPL